MALGVEAKAMALGGCVMPTREQLKCMRMPARYESLWNNEAIIERIGDMTNAMAA